MARNKSEEMPVAQGATHLLFHARNHELETELALLVPWDQACVEICVRGWKLLDQIRKDDSNIISIRRGFRDTQAFYPGGELARWLDDVGLDDTFCDGLVVLEAPPPTSTWETVTVYDTNLIIGQGWVWLETDSDGLHVCDEGIGRNNDVLFGRR